MSATDNTSLINFREIQILLSRISQLEWENLTLGLEVQDLSKRVNRILSQFPNNGMSDSYTSPKSFN